MSDDADQTEPNAHRVTLIQPDGSRLDLNVAEDETILDAALAAGLDLPNMCCQGWCLTCAGRLLSGRVEHPFALRYFEQDAAGEFILLCSAQPREDCVIETHRKQAMMEHRLRHSLPTPRG